MSLIERKTLTVTQTAFALGHVYSGPFLLPRVVSLGTIDQKPAAVASIEITKDNPFLQWHPHAFPGVILAEFTQQLGFLIITQNLDISALPLMIGLETKSKLPVMLGDTITATVILSEIRRGSFYYFDGVVRNNSGKLVMSTSFYGTPAPTKNTDAKRSAEETDIIMPGMTQHQKEAEWKKFGEANADAIKQACKTPPRPGDIGCN